MTESSIDKVIYDIVQKFPEKEWMSRIHEALPDADDGYIMSTIEIFFGGDVVVAKEDGTERSLFAAL